MPDEMIVNPAQNGGGVRAAAGFLSARVLQPVVFMSRDGVSRCLRMRFSKPSW
jgi:hypothetical protein